MHEQAGTREPPANGWAALLPSPLLLLLPSDLIILREVRDASDQQKSLSTAAVQWSGLIGSAVGRRRAVMERNRQTKRNAAKLNSNQIVSLRTAKHIYIKNVQQCIGKRIDIGQTYDWSMK